MSHSLHAAAGQILMADSLSEKSVLLEHVLSDWQQGKLNLDAVEIHRTPNPGRPARPVLVAPRDLPKRRFGTDQGRAAQVHAVAHIEFNAINLAIDAVYRFHGLPAEYYDDWLSVACDEARHCQMMCDRLSDMDYAYGDFPAHNGLWEMAYKTDHSLVDRMGMVPRVFEARGLDVTPMMIRKYASVGDEQTAACLQLIFDEEIRHVAIGNRWFEYACKQRGDDPETTFRRLVGQYLKGGLRGPFQREARIEAGFTAREMDFFEQQ